MYAAYGRRPGSVYGNGATGKLGGTFGNPIVALVSAGVSAAGTVTSSVLGLAAQNKANKMTPQALAAERVRLEGEIQKALAKGNQDRAKRLRGELAQIEAALAALGLGPPPVQPPQKSIAPLLVGGVLVLGAGALVVYALKD